MLKLAKMDVPLAIRWSRLFTGTPTTITVSRDRAGRYFVSFLVEEEIATLPQRATAIGVDLGVKDLAALSTGEKIPNPKHLAKSAKRLKRAHQALSRKQKGSKNREKARRRVACIHAKIKEESPGFSRGECQGIYTNAWTVQLGSDRRAPDDLVARTSGITTGQVASS